MIDARHPALMPTQPAKEEAELQTQTADAVANVPSEEPKLAELNALFQRDPIAAVTAIAAEVAYQVVQVSMANQLSTLKDEAELRGAMKAFRLAHPDAAAFEPFVLQEVASLITDESTETNTHALENWETLLEKGFAQFKEKFKQTVNEQKKYPQNKSEIANIKSSKVMPHMEGSRTRQMPETLPSFTRQQIAAMSAKEFAANEAAIELAMKHGRIS